ncbi:hypothetical protein C8J57DRAFT_1252500 [Mycena rebaudengoi]|nr:hypothetical protein C8J57DRAFT_1252500 [Mycena rebaudengoi]
MAEEAEMAETAETVETAGKFKAQGNGGGDGGGGATAQTCEAGAVCGAGVGGHPGTGGGGGLLVQRIALEAAECGDGEDEEEEEEDRRTETPEGSVKDELNDKMDSDVKEGAKKCDRCREAGEVCVRQGGSKRRSKLVACNLCQSKHVHCSLIEVVLCPNKRQAECECASRRAGASGERASASEAPSNTPKKIGGTIKAKHHTPHIHQPLVDPEENTGPTPPYSC